MDSHLEQQSNVDNTYTAALTAKQAELDQLQQHSQQQQNSLNIVHAQLQAMYNQHDTLQQSLSHHFDSSEQNEALLEASQAQLGDMQQQLVQQEERLHAVEQQLGEVSQHKDRREEQLQVAEGQLQALRQQQAEQAPQVAALVSERQDWIVQLQRERAAASQAILTSEVRAGLDNCWTTIPGTFVFCSAMLARAPVCRYAMCHCLHCASLLVGYLTRELLGSLTKWYL